MADVWVDYTASGAGDNGANPDNAYLNVETGFNTGHTAGDKIYFRRGITFNSSGTDWGGSDIVLTADGTLGAPIRYIGWPRDEKTGTGDWENGSKAVTDVSFASDVDDRGRYVGRMVKNDANGNWYFITAILIKVTLDDINDTVLFEEDTSNDGTPNKCRVFKISGNDIFLLLITFKIAFSIYYITLLSNKYKISPLITNVSYFSVLWNSITVIDYCNPNTVEQLS